MMIGFGLTPGGIAVRGGAAPPTEPIWQSWACIIDAPIAPLAPAILRELTIVMRASCSTLEAWFGNTTFLGAGGGGPTTWSWSNTEFGTSLQGLNYNLRIRAIAGGTLWPIRIIAVAGIRIPAYGESNWSGGATNPS